MNPELREALKELEIAENHFNNADPAYFDLANELLTMAKSKVNCVIKKYKLHYSQGVQIWESKKTMSMA